MATDAAPRDTESEMESALSRDLYLLAPAALPAGMQYSVSGADGQVLFFVKRSRRGRFLAAVLGSIAVGFLVFGFVSSVADSMGGQVLSWSGVILGSAAGLLAATAAYPALIGKRFISFARRDRGNVKVLDANQVDRRSPWEVNFAVTGDKGRLLASARRNYLTGLLRKSWVAYGSSGQMMLEATEESWWRAILGRLFGKTIPALRSNFIFRIPQRGGATLGVLNRRDLIQARHVLDLRMGGGDKLDPQVALGLAVLIDITERG